MPKVSTIIACFNGERFLAGAIESALAQAWAPHEVIVVDDGSTDATREIADRFKSAGVVYIHHEVNRGVGAARNTGLRRATGEFVAILDADDEMMPGRLGKQVEQLLADPSLGISVGQQQLLVEPGAELPDWARDAPTVNRGAAEAPTEHYISGSAMFRRRALEQVGGYDEGLSIGEDTDLIFHLTDSGYAMGTIDEPLIRRRLHGANATSAENIMTRSLPAVLARRIARRRAASGAGPSPSGPGADPEDPANCDA